MIVEASPVWTYVKQRTQEEHDLLMSLLTVRDDVAFHRAAATGGDGLIRFYDGRKFKTGWLPRLKVVGPPLGLEIEVLGVPRDPVPLDPNADIAWLRDYQTDAALKLAGPVGVEVGDIGPGGTMMGNVHAPVASGKTEILTAITLLRPGRWLFLAHRDSLVTQTLVRYRSRTDRPCGRLTSQGEVVDKDGNVIEGQCFAGATFAMINKHVPRDAAWAPYVRGKPRHPLVTTLAAFDGVICDEAHTCAAETFRFVLNRLENAWMRIGLSGTLAKQGDLRAYEVEAALGPTRYEIPNQLLLERGLVAPARCFFIPVAHPPTDKVQWAAIEREVLVKSPVRLARLMMVCLMAAKPGLVFVKDIKGGHLAAIMKGLSAIGVRAEAVSQKTRNRAAPVTRLQRGDLDLLVCTSVFQEGLDVPELASVIVACGGKSSVAAIQRLGRGARTSAGKEFVEVWDFYDYLEGEGPGGIRPSAWAWVENHSRERALAYRSQGHTVTLGALGEEQAPFPFHRRLSTLGKTQEEEEHE